MAGDNNALLRVKVSGIKKGLVQRLEKENQLRLFFHDAGCKVATVTLVMEVKRGDKSRGLSFVDFEDTQSLDLALKLHNREAHGLAGNHGKLSIQKALPATDEKLRIERERAAKDESRKTEHELREVTNQTEKMRQELALCEKRLHVAVRKVTQKCERQNVPQACGLQLQEEKRRQVMLQQVMESIKDAVQNILVATEVKEERAQATVISDNSEQIQQHEDESYDLGPPAATSDLSQHSGCTTQDSSAIEALPPTALQLSCKEQTCKTSSPPHPDVAGSTADDQRAVTLEKGLPSQQMKVHVRNTFIEIQEQETKPLLRRTMTTPPGRTITAPPVTSLADQTLTRHAAKAA